MNCIYHPILFDLDGTLVDSSGDIAASVNRILIRHGLASLLPEKIGGFVGDGVRKLIQRTLKGSPQDFIEQLILDFKTDYRENCLIQTHCFPGIPELLRSLKSIPISMAVVTNKPVAFAWKILRGLGIDDCFASVVGGDECALKPAPEPIFLALERMGEKADSALMAGDHENDILAAHAAGVTSCQVTWGLNKGQSAHRAGPDILCETPRQLSRFLSLPTPAIPGRR
jgi:phosphoglycolate phosphatase